MTRRQHFVTFMSPGTMFDETTSKPIESWDTKTAARMAASLSERYGAKPYGFQFSTSIVGDDVPDGEGGSLKVSSKEVAKSGTYYIDGTLRTGDDVVRDNRANESSLRFNMQCNRIAIVCETTNSWRHTGAFEKDDAVVTRTGLVFERGDDPKHIAYRKAWTEKMDKERGL